MFNFSSIFTGKQDAVDATLEALNVISEPLKSMARMMVDVCAYAGSNREDVLALILPVLGESKANMEVQIFKL